MAHNTFLFVNKDLNSPSLSRNTGREASLASKVNKHVQQQRFWKSSGPRRSWYRPFVRSESSDPSSPTSTESSLHEDGSEPTSISGRRSADLVFADSPPRRSSSSRRTPASKRIPRSTPLVHKVKEETATDHNELSCPQASQLHIIGQPGDGADPFINTAVPLTSFLRAVLSKHLGWVVTSSLTEFAIKEGIKSILSTVLTNEMHSTAFLAMATAQQRRSCQAYLPYENSPEYFSYKATKMIREHIEAHPDVIDPYTIVDIFRLAMSEWLNNNHLAARVHFGYIAQQWQEFVPKTLAEEHMLECVSGEDLFLAIDLDEEPLLHLNWEPKLLAGPETPPAAQVQDQGCSIHDPEAGRKLLRALRAGKSRMALIMEQCHNDLATLSSTSLVEIPTATHGSVWVAKRRLQASLYRLQKITNVEGSVAQCIKRVLTILLFLGTTTPARRVARINTPRLALRLQESMQRIQATNTQPPQDTQSSQSSKAPKHPNLYGTDDPALWLWMSIAGLAAAQEPYEQQNNDLQHWFTKQVLSLALQTCGPLATATEIKQVLSGYLYFDHVQGRILEMFASAKPARHRRACSDGRVGMEARGESVYGSFQTIDSSR